MSQEAALEGILKGLNPAQREAVAHEGGPLLILAGAGSGKTRVLTHRIAYFLARGVPSFNILGVTFTNKAAGEMRERVARLVKREVWLSTFHSIGLRVLRAEAPALGLRRDFTIYDENDQLVVVRDCLDELRIDEKDIPRKAAREAINRAKDYLRGPDELARSASDYFEEVVSKVYALYQKKLAGFQAMDFGDLVMRTVELFEKHPLMLESYQERFKYILVDEYQDTNHAQYRFTRLLAARHQGITVVGDPDQSIYSWRGADISNILNFERDYPRARWIKLEQNYRSTMNILEAANHLIEHNVERKHKKLWSEKDAGEKIVLFEAADEREEALYLVNEAVNYKREGIKLADIVVFYRVHAQSRILEEALRRFKIPYRIVGGIRFYDRKEIKDILAYLKILVFPADEVSLKRILNVPQRGIGKKSVEILEKERDAKGIPLYEAVASAGAIEGLTPKVKKALESLQGFLKEVGRRKSDRLVSELVQEILDKTGYLEELAKERTLEAQSRIENIKEFIGAACDFEDNTPEEERGRLLESFIESLLLQTDIDAWNSEENTLTLMTLHTAKGLEFPIVFMVGMEEDIFPHINARDGARDGLEEERRLCYVGMTRAKEKLHLSYARCRKLYGMRHFNLPSRFLSEIPHGLYETGGLGGENADASSGEDPSIKYDGIDSD
jgi:DNA helicase-2/ATP-dependent DNA helicase PcrA